MPGRVVVGRRGLESVFAAALDQPRIVERVAASCLDWTEATQVLDGALESLWRVVLAPDDPVDGDLPSLDPAQKAWFLVHAGLMRGFNLAVITAWRPSGDTPNALDSLYPGFLDYGDSLVAGELRAGVNLAPPLGDDRARVDAVAGEARRLLRLGLRHGYGLGFLVDAALGGEAEDGGSPDRRLSRLLDQVAPSDPDDPDLAGLAASLAERWTAGGRREPLERLIADAAASELLSARVSLESRARPLAVPSSIARFSAPFVCTMLGYLARWWLAVGLKMAAECGPDLPGPTRWTSVWSRYPIRGCLSSRALAWAREATTGVLEIAGDDAALRWSLAHLSHEMAAIGWSLGRELDSRSSGGSRGRLP